MVDEIPGPAAWNPGVQCLLAQFRCAIEVARLTSHRETLAQARTRYGHELLVAERLGEPECLLGSSDGLLAALCPLGSPDPSQESFDALPTAQLRQQLPQIVDRRLVLVEP